MLFLAINAESYCSLKTPFSIVSQLSVIKEKETGDRRIYPNAPLLRNSLSSLPPYP